MKKMNNKGFSLVELIVVVLIMAIIAVALAPQVMKWVENSRKSTDANNYDSVVSAVNLALADETVMKLIGNQSGDSVLYWGSSSATATGNTWTLPTLTAPTGVSASAFSDKLVSILGTNWQTEMKVKRTTELPSSPWCITISNIGTVSRTNAPDTSSVS